MNKSNKRSPRPADKALGQKICIRRVEVRMSQEELGQKLGLSFQQVQKYEKGLNRVGASRLQQIADALKTPISYFYAEASKAGAEVQSLLSADPNFSIRLLRAYGKSPLSVQRNVVALLESVAAMD
jgi:transcriptional regulator with XRE-family HTH domain